MPTSVVGERPWSYDAERRDDTVVARFEVENRRLELDRALGTTSFARGARTADD